MAPYSIDSIQNTLQSVCKDKRIRHIVLFGSYAKGNATEISDIDLFLDSNKKITGFDFFSLKARIEDAFGLPVDLLPDLDVIPGSAIDNEIKRYGVTVYPELKV